MTSPRSVPLVVAVEMGYGHLRAARPLAEALGVPLSRLDEEPLATPGEARLWTLARKLYESLSRGSQAPLAGGPLRSLLEALTAIGPDANGPAAPPGSGSAAAQAIDRLLAAGLGQGLVRALRASGATLVTTYFVPALIADRAGLASVCVVTDADLARAWVPPDPSRSRIHYCVPGERARSRLLAYGVPEARIEVTGFPLPARVAESSSERLAARIARLDPSRTLRGHDVARGAQGRGSPSDAGAPHLVFAVGGAGAQTHVALPLLRSLRPLLERGTVRLTLVAGTRARTAATFRSWIRETGLEKRLGAGLDILHELEMGAYFARFEALLEEADLLWTKPSELTFYAASGLALLLGAAVGAQEHANRDEALALGAALAHGDPARADEWLPAWLADGRFAAAAASAHRRLPRRGTAAIVARVRQLSTS